MKPAAFVLSCCILLLNFSAAAQCTTHISTFPYVESFEASNGGWTSGGIASSWQWGLIAKPVINSAGGGVRAWSTGGVTGSFYNDGERSWLMSPCFNFSSLTNPMISFMVFWEMERRFDGANIEYSTNGGNTWQILGSENSNANCAGENWFNYSPIRYVNDAPGWSGNIQPTSGMCVGGSGSGGWLRAKHTVSFLAGAPSVRFRFNFGAGTTCNQYDGFAIDEFRIEETPASSGSFSFTCATNRAVNFYTVNRVCQTGVQWNFDDPASGAANTSTEFEPTHVFSQAGVFNVEMTATFSNAAPTVTTMQVTVTDATTSVTQPIACFGGTGSAIVNVSPAGTYNYTWNTSPPQLTNTLQNVGAGQYEVTVTGNGVCANAASVVITEPPVLTVDLDVINGTCTNTTGSVTANVSGGVGPYTYIWNTGATTAQITGQLPGDYSVTVTDANGCNVMETATIIAAGSNITITPTITQPICGGNNGAVNLTISGGTAPFAINWNTGASGPSLTNIPAGSYSVTLIDALGCTAQLNNINVTEAAAPVISIIPEITPDTCNRSVGEINVTVAGGTAPYLIQWNTGFQGETLSNLSAGIYSLTVTDNRGCTQQLTGLTVSNFSPVIQLQEEIVAACNGANGSISITASGGIAPYTYLWNNGSTGAQLQNLAPGNYAVHVSDASGCAPVAGNFAVPDLEVTIAANPVLNSPTCGNADGSIALQPSGGNMPYQIIWNNGTNGSELLNLNAGIYSAEIIDARGCSSHTGDIVLTAVTAPLNISLGNSRNVCNGQTIILQPGSGYASYVWQDGSTLPQYTVTTPGEYSVQVSDGFGCEGTASVQITGYCNDLYFPSAFTPNGDLLNDTFGALGETAGVSNYLLVVYGRWGQEVFRTTDPGARWDGTYKGKLQTMQTFVYMAQYTIGARMPQLVKGTVTLVQ